MRRNNFAALLAMAGIAVAMPMDLAQPTWRERIAEMATVLTNAGRAIITNRLRGSGTEPVYIGWGTAAGTAAAADTTLFTEKDVDLTTGTGTRTTGTSSQQTTSVTNDTWRLTGTRTATGAGTVTNAGCFDSATITAGNLYIKGDFTGIGLSINDSIAFTINHQFT